LRIRHIMAKKGRVVNIVSEKTGISRGTYERGKSRIEKHQKI
jgi:hypothetical protein